jgi:hypothetical protein
LDVIDTKVFRVFLGGSQRDNVYLGWPIAPLNMRGRVEVVSANEYSCAHGA